MCGWVDGWGGLKAEALGCTAREQQTVEDAVGSLPSGGAPAAGRLNGRSGAPGLRLCGLSIEPGLCRCLARLNDIRGGERVFV